MGFGGASPLGVLEMSDWDLSDDWRGIDRWADSLVELRLLRCRGVDGLPRALPCLHELRVSAREERLQGAAGIPELMRCKTDELESLELVGSVAAGLAEDEWENLLEVLWAMEVRSATIFREISLTQLL